MAQDGYLPGKASNKVQLYVCYRTETFQLKTAADTLHQRHVKKFLDKVGRANLVYTEYWHLIQSIPEGFTKWSGDIIQALHLEMAQ